jgi:hypothetical protein
MPIRWHLVPSYQLLPNVDQPCLICNESISHYDIMQLNLDYEYYINLATKLYKGYTGKDYV